MVAGRSRTTAALATGVFALALAVFAPTLGYDWTNYDDTIYVTRNPEILLGISPAGLTWAFSTFQGANWFPLTRLSWMLDYEIHGMQAGGFHAASVLLHALSAAILCVALSRLTRCPWRSAFVAALFAVHPLHVESVAWIAARKDPLSALFFFLALLAYAPGRSRREPHGWAVFACMALALLSKPIAVTLPFVLLLLDAWPLRRLQRDDDPDRFDRARVLRALTEKWPLFALTIVASVVTVVAQRSGGALATLDHVALGGRITNALVAYTVYLGKAVWPSGLAVFYPHPQESLPMLQVALATVFLVGVTVLAVVRFRSMPGFGVGWLWYLGTLVPVIGLVQVGSQAMADRYMYLPLVGLSIAVAWGVPALLPAGRARTPVLAAMAVVILAALTGVASLQLRHWRDSRSLFEHAVRVTSDNHVAHAYLGAALLDEGRTKEGVAHLSEAVRLNPGFLTASNNLAWVLATSDDDGVRNPVLAVPLAQRAAALTGGTDPDVLDTLAAAYAAAGRFEEAVQTAERAVVLASAAGPSEAGDAIRTRLDLYRERRAYREPSAP